MTTEAYITIHDQDLVLGCEESGQFEQLSHTYLFVGHRPVDKLNDVNVIVCRDFMPNYEHMPELYDFSGWFVIASKGMIAAESIICLQYDMTILRPDLEAAVNDLLGFGNGMVAFTVAYEPNWMLQIPGFADAYRAGMAKRGVNPDDFLPFNEWPCTQGTAWSTRVFCDFMAWVEPMFEVFHGNVFGGHLAERTVKAYLAANGIPNGYLPGAIHHQALDVHGTAALMRGDHKLYEQRAATFGVAG